MLQRVARSFVPSAGPRLPGITRMPQKRKGSTKSTAPVRSAQLPADSMSGSLPLKPPVQPRRSSRACSAMPTSSLPARSSAITAVLDSGPAGTLADQTVQQEKPFTAQLAEDTPLAVSDQVKLKISRPRKRKATESSAVASGDTSAAVVNSAQAASKSATPQKATKRISKASVKVEPAGLAAPADVPISVDAADAALDQPGHNAAKSPKQRKPRAKAVIKTQTATVKRPDKLGLSAVKHEGDNAMLDGTTSFPKKPRKQNLQPTKVEVNTETVTIAEPADDSAPAQEAAMTSDGSVTPKKPRKQQKKAEVSVETLLESVHVTPYRERSVPKKWVGAHVSMGGGMERAVVRAAAIGANAFALDTRSKRQWESKPMSKETADAFKQACKDYGFGPECILPHGSYLINLASAKPELLDKSYTAFVDELKRCEMLGIRLYNFHPGSTCGECPAEEGLARIAEQINRAHAETDFVTVVLENMAGGGGSVGHRFDYLKYVIDRVDNKARVGVCLDTCHLFAGGYDVSSSASFDKVMQEFEDVIGLQYLKGMHVNDSKAALGSKRDRHENVAKGLIGKDCFSFLMNDSRFDGMPLIMETPVQCHGPEIDFKLSLLAGAPVFKSPKPGEEEAGENTDKCDIAWLNNLSIV